MLERLIGQLPHRGILELIEMVRDTVLIHGSFVEERNSVPKVDQGRFLSRRVQSHQLAIERLHRYRFQLVLKLLDQVRNPHLQVIALLAVLFRWKEEIDFIEISATLQPR